MRKVRENILASTGDQAVFASGLSVFTDTGYTNVLPGQIVVWDPDTNLSLGAAITCATNTRVVISVGKSSTELRSCFGDEIYGCAIQTATAQEPSCGVPEIWDLYFDCVNCDENYTVMISVQDDQTENQYPYNRPSIYTFPVSTDCCACDTCDTGIDGKALSCKIRDAINGKRGVDDITRRSVYGKKNLNEDLPFVAHVIYGGDDLGNPHTFDFCINPVADACGNCVGTDVLLDSVTFNETTYDLVFNIDPNDPTQTLVSQLDGVIDQINTLLAGNGSAVLTKGAGKCCPFTLQVNTCWTDFALNSSTDPNVAITPCATSNPFATPVVLDPECENCEGDVDAATGVLTFVANATNGDTMTIDAKVYTFQDTLTDVDGNIHIGASASDTLDNAVAAITLGAGAGTDYATSMTLHPTVTAAAGVGDTMDLTAKTPGAAGNTIATTETFTDGGNVFGGATLSGGADAAAAAGKSYTNGIRIIAKAVNYDCDCYPDTEPKGALYRKIKVFPSNGFKCSNFHVAEIQAGALPDNLGYTWQWRDYASDVGGRGRRHNRFNNRFGALNRPGSNDRANATTINCEESYCSYSIEHSLPNSDTGVHGNLTAARGRTVVLIPSSDSTTIAGFEAILNNYITNCDCPVKGAVACGV